MATATIKPQGSMISNPSIGTAWSNTGGGNPGGALGASPNNCVCCESGWSRAWHNPDAGDHFFTCHFDDTPSTFGNATAISYSSQSFWGNGVGDDSVQLKGRILTSDGLTVLAGQSATLASSFANIGPDMNTCATNDCCYSGSWAYVNTTATKADWDGGMMELGMTWGNTMGQDNSRIEWENLWFTLTYNIAVTKSLPTSPRKRRYDMRHLIRR